MIKEELGEEIQVWIQVIQMVGNPIFAKVERITTKKKGLKGPASKRGKVDEIAMLFPLILPRDHNSLIFTYSWSNQLDAKTEF